MGFWFVTVGRIAGKSQTRDRQNTTIVHTPVNVTAALRG